MALDSINIMSSLVFSFVATGIAVASFVFTVISNHKNEKQEKEERQRLIDEAKRLEEKADKEARKIFLANSFLNKDINWETRQRCFDEYTMLGGNSSYATYFLIEAKERENKK
ncbi:MAG: hypothetical protein LBH18_03655 [Spirochaetaceae bacterium]|jgi:hypothetical protein|nr:hypothetical protein [Spirochaetaceae bacterium]